MKLLRLYIHNSGILKNTRIDFTHHSEIQNMICLAGVNGSGKTTVMELIFNLINFINPDLSLQNIFFDRLKPNVLTRTEFAQLDILLEGKLLSLVLGEKKNVQSDVKYTGKQSFIIESEIQNMIKHFENAVVKTSEGDNYEPVLIQELTRVRGAERFSNRKVDKKEIHFFEPLLNRLEEISTDEKASQNIFQNMPAVYFFNAHDREIRDIRYNSIPQEKRKYEIAHRYSPKNDDLTKTLVFYDYAYSDKFNDLKNWVNKHILVGKTIEKIDRVNFQVVIKTKDGKEHGLELLSSGEESLLIIATQLYLRASENTIFLIDEVDQSLHPEFQERVMRLLRQLQEDKCCQIMVSSHSEIIWNTFEEQAIIDLTEMVM